VKQRSDLAANGSTAQTHRRASAFIGGSNLPGGVSAKKKLETADARRYVSTGGRFLETHGTEILIVD